MRKLIIGGGVVGSNMQKMFPSADVHDPPKGIEAVGTYDIAFVCVPTDMMPDGSADTSIVEQAIRENEHRVGVFDIRSTVPPGTTDRLAEFAEVVFSPEYYGGTIHANHGEYDFVIIGGKAEARRVVIDCYKEVAHPSLRIFQTDAKTAELCKYMENCWLATKVTFCNEFFRIAERDGIDYDELRELWLADKRVNRSHTFVYRDAPYFDSHCLNKDVPALAAYTHAPLIEAVIAVNELHKEMV